MKTESYRRSANVSFWNIGLGNANLDAFDPRHDMYVKEQQSWKIRTLKSLKKQLGHENVSQVVTVATLSLSLLCHCRYFVTIATLSLSLLCHCRYFVTVITLSLSLLCHYNYFVTVATL